MEVIDEMGIQADTIGVAPVGCSVLAYEFLNIDMQQAVAWKSACRSHRHQTLLARQICIYLPGRR